MHHGLLRVAWVVLWTGILRNPVAGGGTVGIAEYFLLHLDHFLAVHEDLPDGEVIHTVVQIFIVHVDQGNLAHAFKFAAFYQWGGLVRLLGLLGLQTGEFAGQFHCSHFQFVAVLLRTAGQFAALSADGRIFSFFFAAYAGLVAVLDGLAAGPAGHFEFVLIVGGVFGLEFLGDLLHIERVVASQLLDLLGVAENYLQRVVQVHSFALAPAVVANRIVLADVAHSVTEFLAFTVAAFTVGSGFSGQVLLLDTVTTAPIPPFPADLLLHGQAGQTLPQHLFQQGRQRMHLANKLRIAALFAGSRLPFQPIAGGTFVGGGVVEFLLERDGFVEVVGIPAGSAVRFEGGQLAGVDGTLQADVLVHEGDGFLHFSAKSLHVETAPCIHFITKSPPPPRNAYSFPPSPFLQPPVCCRALPWCFLRFGRIRANGLLHVLAFRIRLYFRSQKKMSGCVQTMFGKRKPRAVSSFLKKTYALLQEDQNNQIVRWASSGIGFIVVSEESFAQLVLPKYFKHSNYSSFVRQLNMYNFHKIREGNTQSYFHHPCFDRAQPHKLTEIRRKPEKKKRRAEEDEEEDSNNSDIEEKEPEQPRKVQVSFAARQPEPVLLKVSEKKIESEKHTRHFFSEERNCSDTNLHFTVLLEAEEDDKLSINNEISERVLPRMPTRELISPSSNNLFPYGQGQGQTSTFCLFF